MVGFVKKQLRKFRANEALQNLQDNVKKCISCGSFVTMDTNECPHCGYEFQNSK